MTPPIRVLIADDHEILREGLRLLLSTAADVEVAGVARCGEDAVRRAAELRPDVVLMDLMMPDMDGIEALRRMRAAGVESPVLILTTYVDDERVEEAVEAGALGYLLKDLERPALLEAVRGAVQGRPALAPEAQSRLMRRVASPPARSPLDGLTPRERDVLRLLAAGRSNKAIAAELGLTIGTVKGYVSTVLAKLGVSSRTQAALYAAEHGLHP